MSIGEKSRKIRLRQKALLSAPEKFTIEKAALQLTELVTTKQVDLAHLGQLLRSSCGGALLYRQMEADRSELIRQGNSTSVAYQKYAASILAIGIIMSQNLTFSMLPKPQREVDVGGALPDVPHRA